jgi:hypothetical protein
VFQTLSSSGFYSLWYWVLTILVWTVVCHRTLGVPYDMILRADRLPAEAERVDRLAAIHAGRVAALHRSLGPSVAAAAGFVLAGLATLGFLSRVEAAQAAFMLAAPLALVGLGNLRLALALERTGTTGPALRRALARRRLWNHVIAIVAILAATLVALANHPRLAFS